MNYCVISLAILCVGAGDAADASPNERVEAAARHYRIQVYNRYRWNRSAYDRHIEAGKELLEAWSNAEHNESNELAVAGWFEQSQQSVLRGDAMLVDLPQVMPAVKEKTEERAVAASPPASVSNPAVAASSPQAAPAKAASTEPKPYTVLDSLTNAVTAAVGEMIDPPAAQPAAQNSIAAEQPVLPDFLSGEFEHPTSAANPPTPAPATSAPAPVPTSNPWLNLPATPKP